MRKIIGLFIGICCMILMAGIDVSSVSAAEVRDWKGSGVGVDPLYANDPFVQEYLEILEQGGISLYASPKKVEKISCKDIYEAGDYVTDLARRRGDAMQLSWIWEGESAPKLRTCLQSHILRTSLMTLCLGRIGMTMKLFQKINMRYIIISHLIIILLMNSISNC